MTRGESRPLLSGPSSSPPPPLCTPWDHTQTASLVSVGEGGGGRRRGGGWEEGRGGGKRGGGGTGIHQFLISPMQRTR